MKCGWAGPTQKASRSQHSQILPSEEGKTSEAVVCGDEGGGNMISLIFDNVR